MLEVVPLFKLKLQTVYRMFLRLCKIKISAFRKYSIYHLPDLAIIVLSNKNG